MKKPPYNELRLQEKEIKAPTTFTGSMLLFKSIYDWNKILGSLYLVNGRLSDLLIFTELMAGQNNVPTHALTLNTLKRFVATIIKIEKKNKLLYQEEMMLNGMVAFKGELDMTKVLEKLLEKNHKLLSDSINQAIPAINESKDAEALVALLKILYKEDTIGHQIWDKTIEHARTS